MTQFKEWDGGDAFGVPAQHWRESYPTPGKLLFVLDDQGGLVQVQQWAPGGGLVPITEENLQAVQEAVVAALTPPPAATPDPEQVPVTRAEYQKLAEDFDWLSNYVITGEA